MVDCPDETDEMVGQMDGWMVGWLDTPRLLGRVGQAGWTLSSGVG